MKIFIFLSVFFLLAGTSCKKKEALKAELRFIAPPSMYAGDYDYMYSEDATSYTDYQTQGHYGIRILPEGKMYFFKNGTYLGEGYTMEYSEGVLHFWFKGENYQINGNATGAMSNYPLAGKQNYYDKIH